MSRKGLLSAITERKLTAVNPGDESSSSDGGPSLPRRGRGAFGAITKSIDELAEKAQSARELEERLLSGDIVVELSPDVIDVSFIADRMEADEKAFADLLEAIDTKGQSTPVLLRPHPAKAGRYMIVFGHRRVAVARQLGRLVRAVVKDISDIDHVIAQGQENSARADLSFIEKASFAGRLEAAGYDRSVVMEALAIDKTVASKMLSVIKDIPVEIIELIGPARESGRDRWYRLALLMRDPAIAKRASILLAAEDLAEINSDKKLERLIQTLLKVPAVPTVKSTVTEATWVSDDNTIKAVLKRDDAGFSIQLLDPSGSEFGEWIGANLATIYATFSDTKRKQ